MPFLTKIGTWLAQAVLIPFIKDLVMTLYKKYQTSIENRKKAKEAIERANTYEANPSTDTHSNLP